MWYQDVWTFTARSSMNLTQYISLAWIAQLTPVGDPPHHIDHRFRRLCNSTCGLKQLMTSDSNPKLSQTFWFLHFWHKERDMDRRSKDQDTLEMFQILRMYTHICQVCWTWKATRPLSLSLRTQHQSSRSPPYLHKQSITHTSTTKMYTPTQNQVLSKSPISTISFPSRHFSLSTDTQTNSEVLPAVPLQMFPTDRSPTRPRRKLESLCPDDLWSSRRSCRRMLE